MVFDQESGDTGELDFCKGAWGHQSSGLRGSGTSPSVALILPLTLKNCTRCGVAMGSVRRRETEIEVTLEPSAPARTWRSRW
jgi:hypothetical protein